MNAVHAENYVINDPLGECGSTITVQRATAPTWGKPTNTLKAWCTDHPQADHPLPELVRLLKDARRGQPG